MKFNQEDYHDFILKYRSPKGEPFLDFYPAKWPLASGRMTVLYFNARIFLDYKEPMERIANFILDFCEDTGITPDYFVNVPEGTDRLTDRLNYKLGGKQVKARARPKWDHGKKREGYDLIGSCFSGDVERGDRIVIVEDVVTTGTSLIEQVEICKECDLNILATICECNRMQKAAEGKGDERKDLDFGAEYYIEKIGEKLYSLTTAEEIVPLAFQLWTPPDGLLKEDVAKVLREEYKEYGIIPLEVEV